jgi:SPP1 family predicted phage head-tail adaptor
MRAGLLTETIRIYELLKYTDETGEEIKEYNETHKIKAHRKKLSASVGNGINANEEFIANTLVFQTRKYSFLNENMRIKYKDNFYNVILLDPQIDNTYLITCSKVNE